MKAQRQGQGPRVAWCTVLGAAIAVAACSKGANNANTASTQDTTVQTASGAVANEPSGTDRAPVHHRRTSESGDESSGAAASAATTEPAAATVDLPSGTALVATSNARVCTNTYHVGDTFTGTTSDAVTGSNGSELPAGSVVLFRVTEVKNSNNMTQSGALGIAVDSIGMNGVNYPAEADITSAATDKVRATSMGQEATKAGIGAAAGGVLGQVIGHNAKSTIIGAAAGLAAGGATALATTKYDFCIPQNGRIGLKLTSDTKL